MTFKVDNHFEMELGSINFGMRWIFLPKAHILIISKKSISLKVVGKNNHED